MSYFTRPFFALVEFFWDVLPLVVVIDIIAIFLLIFKEKMDPRSFAFWIVIIIVFPFIGFALYLVYGCTLYSISIFGRKFGGDREMGIMDDPRIRGADLPTDGNDGRFYGNMSMALRDVVTDLSKAERSVHIEIYRLPQEDISPFVDAICEKASQGLDIRVLMGRGLPRTIMHLRRMHSAGVQFRTFHRRFFALVATTFRFRNRRVMMVVDGRVAYTGDYSVLRTAGPVASRMEARFLADWSFAVGRRPEQVPAAEPAGDITMQVVSSGPDLGEDLNPSMAEYVSMVKGAERSIVLSEPYLVPDENVYNFLKLSALSGVEVKVIVPVRGIRWYQRWNTASASSSLVDSGVRVFMCLDRFTDSLMVVDGRRCALGMAPFNGRAMLQDFHTSVVADSEELSSQMMSRLEELMSHSKELAAGDYGERTFGQRVKIALSRFMMLFNRGMRMKIIDDFLGWTNYIADFVMLLVILDIVFIIILMFMERCDPRSFVAWIIVLLFVPPVGFILYLYLGRTTYWHTGVYNDPSFWRSKLETSREDLEADMRESEDYRDSLWVANVLAKAGADTYTRNNDIKVYTDGTELRDDMFEAMRAAERSILIEYYIIRDDKDGNELMDILTGKVRDGVEVRLMADGFGIKKGPTKAIKEFKKAGGHYAVFHYWLKLFLSPKKSHRNHRKIAIVDGKVAFCGGFNIGDEYRGEGPLGHWRDGSIRVVGDGIIPMYMNFAEDWRYTEKKDPLRHTWEYLDPAIRDNPGQDRMQLVSGGPDTMPNNQVPMQYLAMIQNAKERVFITTPYLDPDESTKAALMYAAQSGVDVRILMPDKKDHIFLYWNNLTFANELMKAGVKVYRYHDGFIHEKAIVIDGRCCSIGSANLDYRSLTLNFETNTVLYSRRLTEQVAGQFLEDLEKSSQYTCEEHDSRTVMMRIRMAVSRLMWMLA
ncbi:MAG: cardiolipin synthase [Thermoplasmata archaeon]|nr:cardiolipin synthase [Thermoplasmata archaeon]